MNLFTNILVTSFLVGLLIINSLTESQDTCFRYRLESNILFNLDKKDFAKNHLQFNFEFLWRPYKGIKNAYTLHLRNPEIVINREINSGSINVASCASNIIPSTRALQAALVVFNDNGLLKEIKVQSNEPELVINIRLYLTSILQINKLLIGEDKVKGKSLVNDTTDELLYIGQCPVSYEVARDNSEVGDNLRILKTANFNECSNVRNKNLVANTVSITEATKINDVIVPQVVTYNASLAYNPWPKSNCKARINLHARLMLQDTVSCEAVPSFIEYDTINITSQHLRPVDEKLLHSWDLRNQDLTNIYSALAAGGPATNINQDIYERALKCWDQIN